MATDLYDVYNEIIKLDIKVSKAYSKLYKSLDFFYYLSRDTTTTKGQILQALQKSLDSALELNSMSEISELRYLLEEIISMYKHNQLSRSNHARYQY